MEQMTLFDERQEMVPLATRLRPSSLEEFAGQEHLLGKGKILRQLIDHSIIFKFFCPQSEHTVHPFCYLVFIGSIALRQEVVNRKRSSLVRLLLKKGNKRKKVNLSKKS